MGELREQVAKAEWESAVDIRWEDVSPSVAERAKERADVAIAVVRAYDAAQPGPREVAVPEWANVIEVVHEDDGNWFCSLRDWRAKPREFGSGSTYQEAITAALAQDSDHE